MPRIFLTLIVLATLLALVSSDFPFLLESKKIIVGGKEIILTSQIMISGLSFSILIFLVFTGVFEKIFLLFKKNATKEKKKDMEVKS